MTLGCRPDTLACRTGSQPLRTRFWQPFFQVQGVIVVILLVEADAEVAGQLSQALQPEAVLSVKDAEAALNYLQGMPPHQDRELPKVILLSLSLPGMGGLELLQRLRSQEKMQGLRVVVLESNPELTATAYESGANSVLARVDGEGLKAQMGSLSAFWGMCERA